MTLTMLKMILLLSGRSALDCHPPAKVPSRKDCWVICAPASACAPETGVGDAPSMGAGSMAAAMAADAAWDPPPEGVPSFWPRLDMEEDCLWPCADCCCCCCC